MAWIIVIVLLLFYGLGLFVFHGTRAIHILPFLAAAVLVTDYLLVRKFRQE